jgi:dihydrofolate reductase
VRPEIIIIAALSENRVIGVNNALPWSIKEDMRRFRELTWGFPCVMGRKTYQSLPRRPLPGRENLVISSGFSPREDPVRVFDSLEKCFAFCAAYEKVFICGGASIYRESMPYANGMELTLVRGEYAGDAFFPEINRREWFETARSDYRDFSFVRYSRNPPG